VSIVSFPSTYQAFSSNWCPHLLMYVKDLPHCTNNGNKTWGFTGAQATLKHAVPRVLLSVHWGRIFLILQVLKMPDLYCEIFPVNREFCVQLWKFSPWNDLLCTVYLTIADVKVVRYLENQWPIIVAYKYAIYFISINTLNGWKPTPLYHHYK